VAGCGDRLGIEALLRDHLIVPCWVVLLGPSRRSRALALPVAPTAAVGAERRLPRDARPRQAAAELALLPAARATELEQSSPPSRFARRNLPGPALLGAAQVATGRATTQLRRTARAARRAAWSVGTAPRGTRRAAQADEGLRIAALRGVERNCLRSEHRQTPRGVCRPCEAEFFTRPRPASSAEQSLRSSDRGGRGDGLAGQAVLARSSMDSRRTRPL